MKLLLMLIALVAGSSMQAAKPVELKLWGFVNGVPGRMSPCSKATEEFIRSQAGKGALTNVYEPTLTIHRPKTPNGTCVIVVPGGAYAFLSVVDEAAQACAWLNSLGITAVLLKYRTPTCDDAAPHDKPVQDALRAIAIVRDNAQAWKLDPKRVGLLGFGAGGNVVAHVNCDRAWQGERPNFSIMVYGAKPEDSTELSKMSESFSVPADAPPVFMACMHGHAKDSIDLTALHSGYAQHRISAQLHLIAKGGLDVWIRKGRRAANALLQPCALWMDDMGLLPSVAKVDAQIVKLRQKLEEMKPVMRRMMGCGNNGEIEMTRKLQAARAALRTAELANDSAIVIKLKKEIAECEHWFKERDEVNQAVKLFFAEAETTDQTIKNLENERVRILDFIESFRWP